MAVTSIKLASLLLICLFLMNVVFTTIDASSFNDSYVDLNVVPYEYFTYPEMTEVLLELEKNYSNIMSLTSIGMTYEGRAYGWSNFLIMLRKTRMSQGFYLWVLTMVMRNHLLKW